MVHLHGTTDDGSRICLRGDELDELLTLTIWISIVQFELTWSKETYPVGMGLFYELINEFLRIYDLMSGLSFKFSLACGVYEVREDFETCPWM